MVKCIHQSLLYLLLGRFAGGIQWAEHISIEIRNYVKYLRVNNFLALNLFALTF